MALNNRRSIGTDLLARRVGLAIGIRHVSKATALLRHVFWDALGVPLPPARLSEP
jgi:hypothetical protein